MAEKRSKQIKTYAPTVRVAPLKQEVAAEEHTKASALSQQDDLTDKFRETLQQEDSSTRQQIARLFVGIYFGLLALLLIGIPIYNIVVIRITQNESLIIKLTDIVQTYSAVVGPTLGFVIAYYFKSKSD